MPFLNDMVPDAALANLAANGTRIDICTQEPATYAGATATHTLGNAAITIGAPQDGDVDGRKAVVPAVAGVTASGTGTATHVAITDGVGVLIWAGALPNPQVVTAGNPIGLETFGFTIRDPA